MNWCWCSCCWKERDWGVSWLRAKQERPSLSRRLTEGRGSWWRRKSGTSWGCSVTCEQLVCRTGSEFLMRTFFMVSLKKPIHWRGFRDQTQTEVHRGHFDILFWNTAGYWESLGKTWPENEVPHWKMKLRIWPWHRIQRFLTRYG